MASKVEQHLSGDPYKFYKIYLSVTHISSSAETTFAQDIQSIAQGSVGQSGSDNTSWLLSKWTVLQKHEPSFNKTYSYHFSSTLNDTAASVLDTTCTFSAAQAGDQILVASNMPNETTTPTAALVKVVSYDASPDLPTFGPLHLETHRHIMSSLRNLQTNTGKNSIGISIQ